MAEEARPAMELILAHYEQMQDAMCSALDSEFGPKPWARSPNSPGSVRSGCGNSGGRGESIALPVQSFEGTYEPAAWDRVVETVREVGGKYGFGSTGTIVSKSDDVEVFGEDEYGGSYVFGMAVNAVLAVRTGCHEWAREPESEY